MGRILFTLVALALLRPATAAADEAPACVLLHNGNIMTGRVEHVGGRLRLSNEGADLWLEESMVAHVAASAAEVYQWRRDHWGAPTVDSHLALAQWCLSQGLLQQAARELLEARAASSSDPRIAAVEERLRRRAIPESPRTNQASPERVESPPAMSDASVAALPAGTLEGFTRHIQPMLLNNCTTGGCHVAADSRFQLDRSLLHGLGDWRTTRFNLAMTLAAIDHDQPQQSALLKAALEPHAGREGPAFAGRRAALQDDLVTWVRAVTQRTPGPARGASIADGAEGGDNTFGLIKERRMNDERERQVSAEQHARRVRDEFDPAEFNRRYGPLRNEPDAP